MEEYSISRVLRKTAITAVPILAVMIMAQLFGGFQSLENDLYDWQTKIWRQSKVMPSDTVLVLVDEASLAAMEPVAGRWPWRRDVWSDLIDYLVIGGAKTIVFDVLFTELSSSQMDGLSPADESLVQATGSAGNIIHACQVVEEHSYTRLTGSSPQRRSLSKYGELFTDGTILQTVPDAASIYLPFDRLTMASSGIGVASFLPDNDGVYRRAQLIFRANDIVLPGISLITAVKQFEEAKIEVRQNGFELTSKTIHRQIPYDHQQRYWVNLYGNYEAFSFSGVYASLMHLKQGKLADLPVHPEAFRDKVVFIGASAAGVEDLKTTGLGQLTPGVLLHASIYGNIMTNDMLRHAPWYVNYLILLFTVIVSSAAIYYYRTVWVEIACAALVLILLTAMAAFSFPMGWLLKIVPSFFGLLSTYLFAFTWISFSMGKERRKIRNVLGQYVSPAILSSVLTDHKSSFLDAEIGQRRVLSIQFSDLRGFTSIAEKYPVEQVVAMLNDYLASMVDVIFEYQGTLDKFIGDAILAFWGAPIEDPEHAYKAVCCAMDMQKALERLNEKNHSAGIPRLSSGFGIHTGEVILGNIGSQKKLDYTVIGDGVNLASRLESLTKKYQCPIIFTQQTYEAVHDRICCRLVDKVAVKGKTQATPIYQPLGKVALVDAGTMQIADLTMEGFNHYCRHEFVKAAEIYHSILQLNPSDALSRLFLDRCNRYEQNPPPSSWLGECVLDHK